MFSGVGCRKKINKIGLNINLFRTNFIMRQKSTKKWGASVLPLYASIARTIGKSIRKKYRSRFFPLNFLENF